MTGGSRREVERRPHRHRVAQLSAPLVQIETIAGWRLPPRSRQFTASTALWLDRLTSPPRWGLIGEQTHPEVTSAVLRTFRLSERPGFPFGVNALILRSPPSYIGRGGTRQYSDIDITRLRQIGALINHGINLAGIARVLGLQADNAGLCARNAGLTTTNAALRDSNTALEADEHHTPGLPPA